MTAVGGEADGWRVAELRDSVDAGSWNAAACGEGGSFFHCHAYPRFAAASSGAEPVYLRLESADGTQALAAGTLLRPRPWPFSRLCATAVLGALPASRGADARRLAAILREVERALRRAGAYRIRIAGFFSPASAEVLAALGYAVTPRAEFYLDLTRSEDALFAALAAARRRNIRQAERAGLRTGEESGAQAPPLLAALQRESFERRGLERGRADAAGLRAIEWLLASGLGRLFVTRHEGRAVNAALFAVFNARAYYVLSGSSAQGNRLRGPAHLVWEAMRRLKSEGVEVLNLGGAPIPDENELARSLYRFKRDFGATPIAQPAGAKIIGRAGAHAAALRGAVAQALARSGAA